MENEKNVRYTFRTSKEIMDKLGYIASKRGRSKNKELEQMVQARIKTFEDKYGVISEDQINSVVEKD